MIHLGMAVAVALGAGLAAGLLSRLAGWGFSPLAIPVGLLVGLTTLRSAGFEPAERLAIAGVATLLGLTLFGLLSYQPPWQAEQNINRDDLDELCVQIVAMRLCRERQMMGVFDFADVPDPVVAEARTQVRAMPPRQKYSLCDRTFGERINENAPASESAGRAGQVVLWGALAVLSALAPPLLKEQFA